MNNTLIFCFAVAYGMAAVDPWLSIGIGLFFCLIMWSKNWGKKVD